jgi:hypothetical protein
MRHQNRTDWPNILDQVTLNMNSTKHRTIGNLRPIDLTSREKAVAVDVAIGFAKESNFKDHRQNEIDFLKNSPIQVNDYVIIAIPSATRGFEQQVI